ncbi:uncharacterized protein HaLaN_25652 [Haematococcus lacustris]|uniref:Uncharacterized protein n=1 Tax=Haematococcus lacustris TaxID=44745 RepID=A0A699ZWP1_HAELA|nr:uncharacterized protein HaLaN_25652 [Haematococcus lacustris]
MPIGPAGNEAYYYFEMQSFYSKRWPGMRRSAEGRWEFQPGFLGPFLGTSQPENMYAASVHHFIFSTWDRLLHAAIAVAYIATAAGAFQMLWAQNYNLAAVLLLGWARQRLELPKLAALLGLAWVNKLWLYWVLLGAKVLDKVLKRIAPPVRGTAWVFFWLWAAYVVFSPLYMHPFPFFGIAPGIDATDHIGPQLYEKPDIPNIY